MPGTEAGISPGELTNAIVFKGGKTIFGTLYLYSQHQEARVYAESAKAPISISLAPSLYTHTHMGISIHTSK